MPLWIEAPLHQSEGACSLINSIKSLHNESLLGSHRDNIPTKSQDFREPQPCLSHECISNLFLGQIDSWQVGNGRNRQFILDKVGQRDRCFFDIKFIIAGGHTDKVRG